MATPSPLNSNCAKIGYVTMTVFQICISIFVLSLGLILSIYNEFFITTLNGLFSKPSSTIRLLTLKELQECNGVIKPELYLSILGNVFDVTKGTKHYGPGGSYNIFVGRDASRSFVTGKFEVAEASDDITGLTKTDLLTLDNWVNFYDREYTKVGRLIGKYYDNNGIETLYHKEIKNIIKEAVIEKENETIDKYMFPPCNVEWDARTGSRVWCTRRSGGIERSWIGFPRRYYEPGSNSYRCACVRKEDLSLGNLQEYEGCNPNYDSCSVKNT